ncbi:hypothetical protein FQA39_LY14348 [Lamprigera yunnana]|nr:hypothetical protein FQA39_LY18410 [Lamprigera yunnana]KAF5291626.1 hypothetical protein FQA39_LY14348 [Lamprigera yunnana]
MKMKIINKNLAEARRFSVDETLGSNFMYIRDKILALFPNLVGSGLKITWKDNDGDFITITGDEELFIALSEMDKRTKVFYVETIQNNNGWGCPFGVGFDVTQLQVLKEMAEPFLQAFTAPRNQSQNSQCNNPQAQVFAETLQSAAEAFLGKTNSEEPKQKQESNANQDAPSASTPKVNPKIEKGLQQLAEMGFKDDSGLVTKLLEYFDGNVENVIRVLAK